MKKTSLTHPLQTAAVSAGPALGRVGVTFCPGKYDRHARTGFWDRDLNLDLDAIRDWGASAVITLLKPKELTDLRVEHLGDEVLQRGMRWFHLPIADGSIPDESFERQWEVAGEEVRTLLRGGHDVLVHCKGGLGRAGMIAARLLVELGMPAEQAIKEVKRARKDSFETPAQEALVKRTKPIP